MPNEASKNAVGLRGLGVFRKEKPFSVKNILSLDKPQNLQ